MPTRSCCARPAPTRRLRRDRDTAASLAAQARRPRGETGRRRRGPITDLLGHLMRRLDDDERAADLCTGTFAVSIGCGGAAGNSPVRELVAAHRRAKRGWDLRSVTPPLARASHALS